MNRQQRADQRSQAFHIRIAALLRAQPELWNIPAQNMERWEREMGKLPAALTEWHTLLHTRSRQEILRLLESDSEEAKRLRASSPFTGILPEAERQRILETFK